MSSLIRQSHANNDKPLWLSTGNAVASTSVASPEFDLVLKDGTPVGSRMTGTGATDGVMYLQGSQIRFTQFQQTGNTTLTTSAPGTNLDYLNVGGAIGCRQLRLNAGLVCGTSSIAVGQTSVTINTPLVLPSSMIFVSFNSPALAGPGTGGAEGNLTVPPSLFVNGTSFTVQHVDSTTGIITAVAGVACSFNWMIINFV